MGRRVPEPWPAAVKSTRVGIARCPGNTDLPLPSAATEQAAGHDLCAAVETDLVLAPGDRALIPTGFKIAIPVGFEAQIRPRSGLALRHGVVLPNAPGTIDADYRGELQVILANIGAEVFTVRRGDRIAQLVVAPVVRAEWEEVATLDETGRGSAGFGSTGCRGSPSAADSSSPDKRSRMSEGGSRD